MKKILSLVLVIVLLLGCSVTFAEGGDMGVQPIGGPDTETEAVSLDDFKLNADVEIDGYGVLCGTEFNYIDSLNHHPSWYNTYYSGKEAEYAMLRIDILNTTMKSKDYLSSYTVKVVYDDVYEFGGWAYQYDFDQSKSTVLDTNEQFPIEPMYQGHYVFGCTLPNAVVNSKKPLRMVITLDENEITYNIRK